MSKPITIALKKSTIIVRVAKRYPIRETHLFFITNPMTSITLKIKCKNTKTIGTIWGFLTIQSARASMNQTIDFWYLYEIIGMIGVVLNERISPSSATSFCPLFDLFSFSVLSWREISSCLIASSSGVRLWAPLESDYFSELESKSWNLKPSSK